MEIVYRKLADLKPNPKNPRKITQDKIERLAESIKSNPSYFEARPIILSDRTGELIIIDGEQRSKAAGFLAMTEVPTILMQGLTEEDEDEIMILGNVHSGVWDREKLDNWSRHKLKGFGVSNDEIRKASKTVDEFKKEFEKFDNNNRDYPIVPMFDEDAEVFVILSRSEIDSNWLRERLNMNKMKSYKENKTFKVNVCSIDDLKKCL